MKNTFFFFITIIISAVIIIGSYLYWEMKVKDVTTDTKTVTIENDNKDEDSREKKKNKQKDKKDSAFDLSERHEAIYEQMKARVDKEEPVRFLMIGSKRTVSDNKNLAATFQEKLDSQLGDLVKLDEITMMDDSIFSFYNSDTYAEHKEKDYDFVIVEPFMLNNQGVLSFEDTELYINYLFDDWKDTDALVIVQPSPKVHVEYIENRHEHLVDFMSNKAEIFIDPWAEIEEDEDIEKLVGEGGTPNDEGIERWADVLASYFVQVKE